MHITTGKSTVSSKGQIVIPADLRQAMGIQAGTEVFFTIKENGACEMKPIRKESVENFFGAGKETNNKKAYTKQNVGDFLIEEDEKTMHSYRKNRSKR